MIELLPVESRSILEVGYDPAARELHVVFKRSSRRYIYEGVPPEVFDRLMASESKGGFVNAEIKNAYPFRIG
jgi:hypothetical protein